MPVWRSFHAARAELRIGCDPGGSAPVFQPSRQWAPLMLLAAHLAHAGPPLAEPGPQARPGGIEEPATRVRMGVGVLTLVRFDAPIVLASVQADTTLVKVVKGDERSLLLTLLRTPAPEEQPTLRVRYADGASPGWASFTVLAPPTGADAQVEVRRQPGPLEGCQAELAQGEGSKPGAAMLERYGYVEAVWDGWPPPPGPLNHDD